MVRLADTTINLKFRRSISNAPRVYQWLNDHGYNRDKNKEHKANFTLFDSQLSCIGGSMKVPDSAREDFFKAYADSIASSYDPDISSAQQAIQRCVYVNEYHAKDFNDDPGRLYFDFDMPPSDDLTGVDELDAFRDLYLFVFNTVKKYCCYQDDDATTTMIVLSAGYTPGAKPKLGYHFVWPNFVVNTKLCLAIRRGLVLALGNHFNGGSHLTNAKVGRYTFKSTWKDIVDEKVFVGGRKLRMPYSRKCIQKARDVCACGLESGDPNCLCTRGVLDLGRPYIPFAMVSEESGEVVIDTQVFAGSEFTKATILSVLKHTTITVSPDTKFTDLVIDEETFVDETIAVFGGAGTTLAKGKAKSSPVEPDIAEWLDKYTRYAWPENCVPGRPVTCTRRKDCYIVNFHSTYCPNCFGDHHTSSTSYLTIYRCNMLAVCSCHSTKSAWRMFWKCGPAVIPDNFFGMSLDMARHIIRKPIQKITRPFWKILFEGKPKTKKRKAKNGDDDDDEEDSKTDGDEDKENGDNNERGRGGRGRGRGRGRGGRR